MTTTSPNPNVILINPANFGTLMVGSPDFMKFRETPQLFKSNISDNVIAVTMGASDLNVDLQFLSGNDMHRTMLISADIIFGNLTAGDLDQIEDIFADTDFDVDQLDDVTAGTVTFKLVSIDGVELPEGGISLDSLQAQVQKFGMALKVLFDLPSGESDQWTAFIGRSEIVEVFGLASKMHVETPTGINGAAVDPEFIASSEPMHVDQPRADGATLEQVAVGPETGEDDNTTKRGAGDSTKGELEDAA